MQTIETPRALRLNTWAVKFLPATTTKGARWSVRNTAAVNGRTVVVPFDHAKGYDTDAKVDAIIRAYDPIMVEQWAWSGDLDSSTTLITASLA